MQKVVLLLATLAVTAGSAAAQQPVTAAAPATPPLEVVEVAPDFSIPGGTRYGVLKDQVKLSDYKGKTVVLAFFFRARTRG